KPSHFSPRHPQRPSQRTSRPTTPATTHQPPPRPPNPITPLAFRSRKGNGRRITGGPLTTSGLGDVAMMGLHKLTAGDGYLYLIRQVAAGDATDRGRPSLADYYSSKGETPGRWMGRGLPALGQPISRDRSDPLVGQLWSVPDGSQVREDQMKALFGEGLHPNADQITRHLTGVGVA